MLFRTVEGLEQKPRRLVVKELTDNGLDEGGKARVGELPNGGGYFVEDGGKGIDGTPAEIARLFSINRPLVSSKLLRLPQRGALGNGLRVTAGAVAASDGWLRVSTRNKRMVLVPQEDGTTAVTETETIDFPVGTLIEIWFGPEIPADPDAM